MQKVINTCLSARTFLHIFVPQPDSPPWNNDSGFPGYGIVPGIGGSAISYRFVLFWNFPWLPGVRIGWVWFPAIMPD
jgi:hypothetical protein